MLTVIRTRPTVLVLCPTDAPHLTQAVCLWQYRQTDTVVFIGLLALTQHDLLDTWAELCSVTLLLPAGLPSIYTYTHTHTLRHTHTHMIMFTLTIKDADTYFTWSSEYRQTGVHSHTQKLNGHAHTFNHKIPCNASNAHTTGTHTHTPTLVF